MTTTATLKAAALSTLAALALASAAHASTLPIQIVNHGGVSAKSLQRVEAGWLMQLNHQLRPWWKTPTVKFTTRPAVYRLVILRARDLHAMLRALGTDGYGIHSTDEIGPVATIGTDNGIDGVSLLGSHELIEMLTNANGDRELGGWIVEPCDAVNNATYLVWPHEHPVLVQDFVLPHWYVGGAAPFDQDHATKRAGDLTYGHAWRVDAATGEITDVWPGGGVSAS